MQKGKRILAILGVIFLLGLYLATFIVSLSSNPASDGLFKACIYSTIMVPVLLYVYIFLYKLLRKDEKDKDENEITISKRKKNE